MNDNLQPTADRASRKPPPAVQAPFLNRALGRRVSVLLMTGETIVGTLKAFDQFTVEIEAGAGGRGLLYKHGIAGFLLNGGER